MTTAAEKMEQSKRALAENPQAARAVGAVYKFILEGEGGGTFLVNLKGTPSISEGDGSAECTLKMAAEDYVALLDGKVQGQDLFFAGKLQIEGDMSLAMKLQDLRDLMAS